MHRISGRTRVLSLVLAATLAGFGATGVGQPAHASPATSATHLRPTMTHAQASDALSRAELLFHGTRAQSRMVQRHEDATMVLRDLRLAYPGLTTSERAQVDRLLARPSTGNPDTTNDISYAGPEAPPDCDANICVHYVKQADDTNNGVADTDTDHNSIPDYVDEVLATVEHVRSTYAAAGYRTPLDDSASADNGGDRKTDIYLAELGNKGFYGYCTSDDPNLASNVFYASAYCVLDNNFTDGVFSNHTPLQNLQVTTAHEFFHAVQFAYDIGEDQWIMEATATWAEDQLYTTINDNMQYLRFGPNPITAPGMPLDTNGDVNLHWYGTWIFFRFLTERLVTTSSGGLPLLMLQIWRKLDSHPGSPDMYSILGVKSALASHGIDLTSALSRFDLAARHPTTYFHEAAANHYPSAPIATSSAIGPGHLKWSSSFRLLHLSYRVLRLTPKAGTGKAWHLKVHLDLPPTSHGGAATLWINKKSGGTSAKLISLSSTGDATFRIAFNAATVKNVELEVINASPRFTGCFPSVLSNTYYSCYAAHGADDKLADNVQATAYKA